MDSAHHLWLIAQQHELYQQIKTFEGNLLNMQVSQSELIVVVELLLMILHVSPEELQRFAGKNGKEAASQAFACLEKWSGTEQARKAIWHAGQVFRWAALMPPAELRDFFAIAVYFASLALWAFGHLASFEGTHNGSTNQQDYASIESDANGNGNFVVINCEETSSIRPFIAGHQATPVLTTVSFGLSFTEAGRHTDGLVRLDDPNSVLQMARDLYRANFPIENEPLPPLVENMGNLMRDLGSLPENRVSRCVSPVE
jgi:hypothetical protein